VKTKGRQTLLSLADCPQCHRTTAYEIDTQKFRWCLYCNISFYIKYSRRRHSFYRSKISKGINIC
jgi:hypothetical protein